MSTHSDAPTVEKVDVEQRVQVRQPKPKKGFFSRSKRLVADPESDDVALDALDGGNPKPPQKDVAPASFTSLFR